MRPNLPDTYLADPLFGAKAGQAKRPRQEIKIAMTVKYRIKEAGGPKKVQKLASTTGRAEF